MKNFFLLFLTLLIISSCGSTKKTVYFQGIDQVDIAKVITEYEVRIMPNDNLHITVSAINPEAAEMFNNMNMSRGGNINYETLNVMGYLVDSEGFINFPVLGKIHLGGLTKTQAINYLTEKISEYIEDPVVNVRFINYKVTILGEVKNPGTYTIKDEKVTLLEAIGMAGDLTIFGKRDNVLITRETDGIKTAHRLDLTSPDILSSDYYYLQQNDVVYV
ncbi:MAG: polysaccharide biosynthesis/export family protein, partial [Alistipes sp.]|nr:polysaccharide biosynthesis/export family protein [Alistipes sp.]